MGRNFEGRLPAAVDLRRDEARLRGGVAGSRVAVLADRTVSLGVAQAPDAPAARRARAAGLDVVRRGTGGTGVLHLPGDLAWSIVLPRSDPRVGRDFPRAYARLGAAVVAWLAELDLPATWSPSPGLSEEMCLLGPRGEVATVAGRVVGGAAQHLTARAFLHHGVVSVETDRDLEATVFDVPAATLAERRAGLRDLGVVRSSEALGARLAFHLAAAMEARPPR